MRTFKTKERKKLAQKVLTVGLGTVALSVLFYKFNKDIIPILKKWLNTQIIWICQ